VKSFFARELRSPLRADRGSRAQRRCAATRSIPAAYLSGPTYARAAGIPTVVFGPIGAGAHAAEEWIDLNSAEQAALIYAQTALDFCQ
jgi:acetylornithine deacetylase